MDIAKFLKENAEIRPDKPAFIFKEQKTSFLELKETVYRLADSLKALGFKKGDKLAIYLPSWPQYIFSYLAAWCSRATVVPLDFMLTEEELVSYLVHSEAKILIAKPKANISLEAIKNKCPLLKQIIVCGEGEGGYPGITKLISEGKITEPDSGYGEEDYAIIFYTSGTTGKPKGVLVNYRQLIAPAEAFKYFVGNFHDDDVALSALPWSHLGGLVYLQIMLYSGVTVVMLERFIPSEFLRTVQQYRINCFWIVPSMYYALIQLKEFEAFDLSSLRWIVLFGAPSSIELVKKFHARCPGAVFYHGWGLTETNAPTAVIPTGSDRIESVGKPPPWVEVKVFNDDNKEVAQGGIGEIVVKSWVVTDGYFKDPGLTDEVIRDGWFYTGDLGRFDKDGYLYIVGRKKEMIKVAGEIVFEPEVEAVIYKYPQVSEAAVIGVPDKLRGEVPKAFIVPKEGAGMKEEELKYFCRQHLAHFKIPHYFEFLASLPKNRAGKIDKGKLRRGDFSA